MVRPDKVIGATYKLRWPDSEHAMYVTVNDVELDGVRRPFEVSSTARTSSITHGWSHSRG